MQFYCLCYRNFGNEELNTYTLSGVADALAKNAESESKGIKAHFRMDDSGILHLDAVSWSSLFVDDSVCCYCCWKVFR